MQKASGVQRDRPELKAALQSPRRRHAGGVDARSAGALGPAARGNGQRSRQARDRYRVLTQAIDTTSPGGRLLFHVIAAVAEFERELTLERTHAGLAQARAFGRRDGRKPAMGPAEIKRAKAMLADPTITAEEGGSADRSAAVDALPPHSRRAQLGRAGTIKAATAT